MVGSTPHLRNLHFRKKRPPRWRSAERLRVDMLGHNGGPPLDTASSWNGFCWRKAVRRARATPAREVLAIRTRRAAALGLDCATYASILADCGATPATLVFAITRDWVLHDPFGPSVTADGALRVTAPALRRLTALTVPAVVAVTLTPAGGPTGEALARAIPAAAATGGWRLDGHGVPPAGGPGEIARWLVGLLSDAGLSARTALLIGDPDHHTEIATRARLAGVLSAARYFR